MGVQVLSDKVLNRTLLSRQLLLRRRRMNPLQALEHLVGMQTQAPFAPYIGLWTRLTGFRPATLAKALESHDAARVATLRSTLHLHTAQDALAVRAAVQPALNRQVSSSWNRQLEGIEWAELAAAARQLVEDAPITLGELGKGLAKRFPDRDAAAMAFSARNLIVLVQPPPRAVWGKSGQALHVPADQFFAITAPELPTSQLVLRYLRAYGPASVKDAQTWSGLTGLRAVFNELAPQLVEYRDDQDNQLYDVAGSALSAARTHAPIRMLPEFDNILLSHARRTRILDDAAKKAVFTVNGTIRATVLVDGFVAAMWTTDCDKGSVSVTVEALTDLSTAQRDLIRPEAQAVGEFLHPNAKTVAVVFGD